MKRSLFALFLVAVFAFAQVGHVDVRTGQGISGRSTMTTTNAIPKVTGLGTLGESGISDDGTTVSASRKLSMDPGGTVASWKSYTVTYEDSAFLAAATDVDAALFTLPANGVIEGVRIKHSTAVAGTAVSSFKCSIGTATDGDAYSPVHDAFVAASDTAQTWDGGAYSTTAAQQSVVLNCISNVNVGDGGATILTAGSITASVKWAVLP